MFKPYDIVRIVELRKDIPFKIVSPSSRVPQVNDVATIVELYTSPKDGFELECTNANGQTEWLESFASSDVELELVSRVAIAGNK